MADITDDPAVGRVAFDVDQLILNPTIASMQRLASIARLMHVGHVNAYAMYILVTMLFILVLGALIH